jgi:hypothetical protein
VAAVAARRLQRGERREGKGGQRCFAGKADFPGGKRLSAVYFLLSTFLFVRI